MKDGKWLLLSFCDSGYDLGCAFAQTEELARLLESCGMHVETPPSIQSMDEAAEAAQAYHPYRYDGAVLFCATWTEPRLACTAARAFFGMPLAVWCVNDFMYEGRRTEMSSAPAAAALRGCLAEMGVPCEFFAGLEGTSRVRSAVAALTAAGCAIRTLRTARVGFFGHNFNGITAAGFDLSVLRRRFGTEVYSFDVSELLARVAKADGASPQFAAMHARVSERVSGVGCEHLDRIVRMCLALEGYVEQYRLDALNVRCHTELSQSWGLTACLPLAVLGDRLPCACEADLPVTLTQLLLHALSGGKVTAYADLRTFTDEGMEAGACGYAPCALTGGRAEVGGCEAPDVRTGPGYLTNRAPLKTGRLTLARLLKYPGGRLGLHLTGGEATAQRGLLQEMYCPYYPMTHIRPDVPMEDFLKHLGANHYALVYDDVLAAAELFCKYADVERI